MSLTDIGISFFIKIRRRSVDLDIYCRPPRTRDQIHCAAVGFSEAKLLCGKASEAAGYGRNCPGLVRDTSGTRVPDSSTMVPTGGTTL